MHEPSNHGSFLPVLLFSIVFLHCYCGSADAGKTVMMGQNVCMAPYEEALKGFKALCPAKTTQFVLCKLDELNVVSQNQKLRPDLMLAVGEGTFAQIKGADLISAVCLMYQHPHFVVFINNNIVSIPLTIPAERQLNTFLSVLPDAKTIGVLYIARQSGCLVEEAQQVVQRYGVTLIAKEVHSTRDVFVALQKMWERVDIFWMLPDIDFINPDTMEYMFLSSMEYKVPILSFKEEHIAMGAFMSIRVDPFDVGQQAGEISKRMLSGKQSEVLKVESPRTVLIWINMKTARKFDIKIPVQGKIRNGILSIIEKR